MPHSKVSAFLALVLSSCSVAQAQDVTWQEADRRSAEALQRRELYQAATYARRAFDLYESQDKNYTVANHAQLLLNFVRLRVQVTWVKEALKEFEIATGHLRKKAGHADPSVVSLWEEGARISVSALEMNIADKHYGKAADEADELWGERDPRAILIHNHWANDLRQQRGYFWARGKLSDARERAAGSNDALLQVAIERNLASLETEAGKHARAIPIYRSLIERLEAKPDLVPKATLQGIYAQLEYACEEIEDSQCAKQMHDRLVATFDGHTGSELEPIFRVEPKFPIRASQGSVSLRVWVRTDGSVRDVVVVRSGDKQFEQPAIDAVRRWKFQPRLVDGQFVEHDGIVKLQFRSKVLYKSG